MKYKHIKTGIEVEFDGCSQYVNRPMTIYLSKEMVEDSQDWQPLEDLTAKTISKQDIITFWNDFNSEEIKKDMQILMCERLNIKL